MPTAILDLDGPLLDGKDRHYACYAGILAEHGHAALAPDDYWERKRQRQDRRELLAATGAGSLYNVFLRQWLERIETPECLALDRVQVGVPEKLSAWRAQGVRLALATQRRDAAALTDQLRMLGLAPYFDQVVVCDHAEGGAGKARRALAALGAGDRPALWVGDTEVDIEAARAAGCPAWAVCCGLRTEDYLRSRQPEFLSERVADIDLGAVR